MRIFKDLGLSHNFELEMDNSRIIQPVIANLLSKISANGGYLSDALVNFALQKLEDGKSYNIESDLEKFSEHLFKEQAITFISSSTVSVSQCLNLKNQFIQRKSKIFLDIKQLSDDVITFFNKNNFTKNHFIRGTYFNHFTKNLQYSESKKWIPSDALQRNIMEDIWYSQSSSSAMKNLVDSFKNQLIQFYIDLQRLLSDFNTNNSLSILLFWSL